MISLNAQEIILGVVPQQSPLVLTKKWEPVVKYLSERLNVKVVFKTEMSIPKFQEELYAGKYDIAYMNPYHYVVANKKQAYQAIIRSDKLIQGIVVSHSDNNGFSKRAFKDKTFLFPAPKAFAATLLVKYELKKLYGFDIDKHAKVLYVNSHDSVYKGVSRGFGDFGGGINRTFLNLDDKKTKENISIVYRTQKYPSHPIAINKKITLKQKMEIENALLSLPSEFLGNLNFHKLIRTNDNEYSIIRELLGELEI